MREGITSEIDLRRFAFVGNMNNMPFLYAREMKDLGLDAVLFVDAPHEVKLDRPESVDSSIEYPYPNWLIEIPPPKISPFFKRLSPKLWYRRLIAELNKFDVVILNGNWITLGPYLRDEIIVYALCAGYEIDALCDLDNIHVLASSDHVKALTDVITKKFPFLNLGERIVMPLLRRRLSLQRRGVRRSDGISYYSTGISQRGDQLIAEIMFGKAYRRLELRGFPTKPFKYVEPDPNKRRFTLINYTRFSFLNEQLDNKRNDIMLEGIGLFLQEKGAIDDLEIIFFSKGNPESLERTKEMAAQMDFARYIEWKEPVSLEELFNRIVPDADVVFDQFGAQWLGAGLYAMLVGRPVIANERPEIFRRITGSPSPVCQASTPEEVCEWLVTLYDDRSKIRRIGLESRAYVEKHYDISKTIDFFRFQRIRQDTDEASKVRLT